MHACACGGVCVRVGLASHLQTGNSHIVITTPRSGEDFCLNRNQYLWGWSPMLNTQTKWGKGFHFPRGKIVWPPPDWCHQCYYCLRFLDPRKCSLHTGAPGGHPVTSSLRILLLRIHFFLLHYPLLVS